MAHRERAKRWRLNEIFSLSNERSWLKTTTTTTIEKSPLDERREEDDTHTHTHSTWDHLRHVNCYFCLDRDQVARPVGTQRKHDDDEQQVAGRMLTDK